MFGFGVSARQRALELAASSALVSLRPELRPFVLNGGDPLVYLEKESQEIVVQLKAVIRESESAQMQVATLSALCGSLDRSLHGEQTVHTYDDAVGFLNQQIELAEKCESSVSDEPFDAGDIGEDVPLSDRYVANSDFVLRSIRESMLQSSEWTVQFDRPPVPLQSSQPWSGQYLPGPRLTITLQLKMPVPCCDGGVVSNE